MEIEPLFTIEDTSYYVLPVKDVNYLFDITKETDNKDSWYLSHLITNICSYEVAGFPQKTYLRKKLHWSREYPDVSSLPKIKSLPTYLPNETTRLAILNIAVTYKPFSSPYSTFKEHVESVAKVNIEEKYSHLDIDTRPKAILFYGDGGLVKFVELIRSLSGDFFSILNNGRISASYNLEELIKETGIFKYNDNHRN